MKTTYEIFWALCEEIFSKELTKQQLSTWIKPLEFKIEGGKAQIIAPNQFVLQWVKEKFAKQIQIVATEHLKNLDLEYIVIKKINDKYKPSFTKVNEAIFKAAYKKSKWIKPFI